MERREFLDYLSALTASVLVTDPLNGSPIQSPRDQWGELLPQRILGKSGEKVTMLGTGGWHIGNKMDDYEAQKTIETAIEGGIRFFDTAESYANGGSEIRYGKFLTPKYREDIYLMTKSRARTAKEARQHLEGSLQRLKTDYLDLWQVHSVNTPDDVDNRIANGVVDVFLQAQEEGKVKHIGLTGHHMTAAHLRMLNKKGQQFQTCQMPVNVADPVYDSFIENVMPQLTGLNIGPIAMKSLANGGFFGGRQHGTHGNAASLVPDVISIREALHFTWSLPVSTIVTGADNHKHLQEKIGLAHEFKKLTPADRQQLIDKVKNIAAGGEIEFYKA